MLRIYVPTHGRPDRQRTADALEAAGLDHELVSCEPVRETSRGKLRLLPQFVGIMEKRQWILDDAGSGKIVMLDDDLSFKRRRADGGFSACTSKDVAEMFAEIDVLLDTWAHVGIVDQFLCNVKPRGLLHRGKYSNVLGYNLDMMARPRPRFRLELCEEQDFNLQLQDRGLEPAVSCEWSKTQASRVAGGCSSERTVALQDSVNRRFHAYWPNLVTLREKVRPGIENVGYKVAWRKALRCIS